VLLYMSHITLNFTQLVKNICLHFWIPNPQLDPVYGVAYA